MSTSDEFRRYWAETDRSKFVKLSEASDTVTFQQADRDETLVFTDTDMERLKGLVLCTALEFHGTFSSARGEKVVDFASQLSHVTRLSISATAISDNGPLFFGPVAAYDNVTEFELRNMLYFSPIAAAQITDWFQSTTALRSLVSLHDDWEEAEDLTYYQTLLPSTIRDCTTLTALSIGPIVGEPLGFELAQAFAESHNTRLLSLTIDTCVDIGASFVPLTAALRRFPLQSLALSTLFHNLDGDSHELVRTVMALTALTSLHFVSPSITASSSIALHGAIASQSTLQTVFVDCPVAAADIINNAVPHNAFLPALARLACCTALHSLSLNRSHMPGDTLNAFVDALEHNTMITTLHWTDIGPKVERNSADELRMQSRLSDLLHRNRSLRWHNAHILLSHYAFALAALDLPAYVCLEIMEFIDNFAMLPHSKKIHALILVKNKFRSKRL